MADITSKLTHTSKIQWSDGSNFNGYVLAIAALPALGAGNYPQMTLVNEPRRIRLPQRFVIPITDGDYDEDVGLLRTDKLVPPNVKYCSWFYDTLDTQIAPGSTLFTATSAETALVPPTLTVPTAAAACVQPESSTLGPTTIVNQVLPTREDVSGTKNGSNTSFTISKSGSLVQLFLNGLMLDEGVAYTISGTAITMLSPYIPESTDSFEALIYG